MLKGISQVDFAIASAMFILLFAFLVGFATDYFTSMKNDVIALEKKTSALTFFRDLLSEGEPQNWASLLREYRNETGAYWGRSFKRATNETLALFTNGEINQSSDAKYACVVNDEGADAFEAKFPNLSLPGNAIIGEVKFKVIYNATSFETSGGSGDWKDDFYVFSTYLEDWGGTAGIEWIEWNSSNAKSIVKNSTLANAMRTTLYYKPTGAPGTACFDLINVSVEWSVYPFYPRKLGLMTKIYEFTLEVNNSLPYYKTPAASAVDLTNELVEINFSQLGFSDIDFNSIRVYEGSNPVACAVNSAAKTLNFTVSLAANQSRYFTILFDDDSNFTAPFCDDAISGVDNLSEIYYPIEGKKVLQYRKLAALNESSYELMKSSVRMSYNFNLTLFDENESIVFSYGKKIPRIENVYSFETSVMYQNSTGDLRSGKLRIYVW